jgi:hypothetical protein
MIVNRALIKRLLNEYLDGEIGMADKAELERQMAADPALRKEYQDMRRVGLLLGSQPEILVHPYRFRQQLLKRLSAPQVPVFTPQRAFAGAMLVALMVVTMTFALVMYQEKLLGGWNSTVATPLPVKVQTGNDLKIYVGASTEAYCDRLLLETQLGLLEPSALAPFIAQTSIYEGATCTKSSGLRTARFQHPLPEALRLNVTAHQAQLLLGLAQEVGGDKTALMQLTSNGSEQTADFERYLKNHGGGETLRLYLEFQ